VILHPGVLALLVAAAATGGLLLFAAWHAAEIVRGWDLSSGSERQLQLERRTYLVSTLLRWVLAFELVSVFLYVYTADALAPLFTGAMCAAGSLKAGSGGYAVLVLKLVGFVAAGLWLVLNAADERGRDYPLVRRKYGALLAIAPLLVAEAWLLFGYFGSLRPNVITSCCGSLFSQAGTGVGSDLAALSHRAAAAGLMGTAGGSVLAALAFRRWAWAGWALALLSAAALPVSLAAVVSWISPYVYELPTHHCPFCILQREYRFVGYPLYAALLGGSVAGMGVGVLMPFRGIPSLAVALPALQRRLATVSAVLLGALLLLTAWLVGTSGLRM
jgi:hypothetical protein